MGCCARKGHTCVLLTLFFVHVLLQGQSYQASAVELWPNEIQNQLNAHILKNKILASSISGKVDEQIGHLKHVPVLNTHQTLEALSVKDVDDITPQSGGYVMPNIPKKPINVEYNPTDQATRDAKPKIYDNSKPNNDIGKAGDLRALRLPDVGISYRTMHNNGGSGSVQKSTAFKNIFKDMEAKKPPEGSTSSQVNEQSEGSIENPLKEEPDSFSDIPDLPRIPSTRRL